MSVLLIVPEFEKKDAIEQPPIGLAYIAAVLSKNGIDTEVIDMRLGYAIDDILKVLNTLNPDIVGITSYSLGFEEARKVIKAMKENGARNVVIGGAHVSAVREEVLRETDADFAVKGEGEYTILELHQKLQSSNPDFGSIDGLIWKDGTKIIENKNRGYIQDLDSLPFPDYERFELKKYLCYSYKTLALVTSRGCPYHCIFCSVANQMGNRFRPRSPENTVSEIEHWYKKGYNGFKFYDDNFSVDIKRVEEICDLLMQRHLNIKWIAGGVRADRITRELVKKMKKAGCFEIAFGVESADNEVLKNAKKGETIEEIKNAIKISKEEGLQTVGSFIIGLPGENYSRFEKSLNFAQSTDFDMYSFFNLVPYPGTELWDWVEKNASFVVSKNKCLEYISYHQNDPIFETPEFPFGERKKAFEAAHKLQEQKEKEYQKKLIQNKFGNIIGSIAWYLKNNTFTRKVAIHPFTKTRLGREILQKISKISTLIGAC